MNTPAIISLPAPNPDPSWDYYEVWQKFSEALCQMAVLHSYLEKVESASDIADRSIEMMTEEAIRHLKKIFSLLGIRETEEEFQAKFPTFILVGKRVINPAQIIAVNYDEVEGESTEEQSVEILFASDSSIVLYDKEAEIVKKFFMFGSRTYDLDSLFG